MGKVPNILVFDSGIGGISVYNEVRQKIPHANYIYLFDNYAFPYGDKSNDFLIDRVNSVIKAAIAQYAIDLVIIACNTASTICLPSLRSAFSLPIVGVVPAIKPAVRMTKNGCIGLLATKATVQREYTHKLIDEFAQGCHVELLGLSELALIAERKLQGVAVNIDELRILMQPWLSLATIPDTIVLGCTHYPFIKEELQIVFPNTVFIDSGYAIASRVCSLLQDHFDITAINSTNNLVSSTLYNKQVEKLIVSLKKYNLNKYQLISISAD